MLSFETLIIAALTVHHMVPSGQDAYCIAYHATPQPLFCIDKGKNK